MGSGKLKWLFRADRPRQFITGLVSLCSIQSQGFPQRFCAFTVNTLIKTDRYTHAGTNLHPQSYVQYLYVVEYTH